MQWIPQQTDDSVFDLTRARGREPDTDLEWLRLFERLVRERDEATQQVQAIRAVAEQSMMEAEEQAEAMVRLERERDQAFLQLSKMRELAESGRLELAKAMEQLAQRTAERDDALAQVSTLRAVNEDTQSELESLVSSAPNAEKISALERALDQKDERMAELLDAVALKSERVGQLEATLKMLAEADEA